MTETETAATPVTRHRRRADLVDAVQWDGSPEVLAVLEEWGAEPLVGRPLTAAEGHVRIWGSVHGYGGAAMGDWLVRRPGGQGADRYKPEFFTDAFEPAAAEADVAEPGLREALRIIRRLGPLALGDIAAALNDGRPVIFFDLDEIEGWVCAVPDPAGPDGFCGSPVESGPCARHTETPEPEASDLA